MPALDMDANVIFGSVLKSSLDKNWTKTDHEKPNKHHFALCSVLDNFYFATKIKRLSDLINIWDKSLTYM